MSRHIRKIPLATVLVLIGLLPFLLIAYLGYLVYVDRLNASREVREYASRVGYSLQVSRLTSELQKERRISFIRAHGIGNDLELIQQRRRTDSMINLVKQIPLDELRDFARHTFLDELPQLRQRIDQNEENIDEKSMAYFTLVMYRLNSLSLVEPSDKELNERVAQNRNTHNAFSQLITYFGALRAQLYNYLYDQNTANISRQYELVKLYRSYELELKDRAPSETLEKFTALNEQPVFKKMRQVLDSSNEGNISTAGFSAEEWWDITGRYIDGIYLLQSDLQVSTQSILDRTYKRQLQAKNITLTFLVLAGVVMIGIVSLALFILTYKLSEIKRNARRIARGLPAKELQGQASDVIGDLALSISEIDRSNRLLSSAADQIGRGNFDVEIPQRGENDVLGQAILRMKSNLEQFTGALEESKDQFQQLAERYQTIFYKSPLPMLILEKGTGRFLEVNEAAINHYGYTLDEFRSMDISKLEMNGSPATNGTGVGVVNFHHHLTRDGRERMVELSDHAIDYNQQEARLVVVNDITEQKQAEHAIRASEKVRSLIMNAALDAIICMDTSGKVIVWNPQAEKIFGWSEAEAVGHRLAEMIIPFHYRDQHNAGFKRYMQTGKGPLMNRLIEITALNRQGKEFPVELSLVHIRQGGMEFFCSFIRDISFRKQAEEKIQAHSKRTQLILQTMQDGFVLTETDGRIVDVNPAYVKMIGYSREQLLRMNLHDLETKLPREVLEKELELLKNTGNLQLEGRNRTRSGREIDVEVSISLMEMEGRTLVAGFVRNITERKRAEQTLSEERNLLRSLIDNLPDYIYVKDPFGRYMINNSAFVQLVGLDSESDILGKRVRDLFPKEIWDINEQEDRRVVEEGMSVLDRDEPLVTRMGDHRWLLTSKIPLRDMEGKVVGILGISKDITERKKAEEALRQSEQKYRLLFEDNPLPLWMFSLKDFRFIDVNDAAVQHYGYSKEEFLSMTIFDIRPDADIEEVRKATAKTDSGVRRSGVWRHRKKNGQLIKVEVVSHDTRYGAETVRLVLAIDVTEKIKSEEALKKSYEEIRELASHLENIREEERINIAREIHDELGQQLTVLKMDISWLRKRLAEAEPPVREKLEGLLRLLETTVITVRRISSELRPSMLDDLGLVAALEWQSDEFERRTGIASSFKGEIPDLDIDRKIATGIFRIYQESLTNVARHAQASEVKAELNFVNDQLVLNIRDNGNGFLISEIENKKTLGILGMKERAIMMGGQYRIQSTPGKGTTITVEVPLRVKKEMNTDDSNSDSR